jgi:hypothetical protein
MSDKKKRLKYKKERCLLSDVLPYEIPITFSNRYFYDFLLKNKVEFRDETLSWASDDKSLDSLVKIIFNIPQDHAVTTGERKLHDKYIKLNTIKKKDFETIPFTYKISHKENQYREMSICHPQNQIQIVNFYHNYKELILYYCNVSSFSIRRPKSVSKYTFFKDKTHYDSLPTDDTRVEEHNKEYENLRSFFVYKEYSNIYKFYESHKFHRAEKKYDQLIKLDISKCFDSIYTHSLSWALLTKESTKENIKKLKNTFADRFDSIMRDLNYKETNGIVIGPEFSRIFAELILQSVDKSLERKAEENNLRHKVDYEIFRYVDDYFIFYNSENTKDKILEFLQINLKTHKLHLNTSKQVIYKKPIITEISIAKDRIANLLEKSIEYNVEDFEQRDSSDNLVRSKKGSIHINSKKMITQFKLIIKECNVEYKDMLNYTLAIIDRKCKAILKKHHSVDQKLRPEKQLIQAIVGILDFVFFIYSVSPRVNTTIKLCRILSIFTTFLSSGNVKFDYRHLIYKLIYDNICFILKKNRNTEHSQVETLYLLLTLGELRKNYWLEEDVLANYLNIKIHDRLCEELNYFSITVLLSYIKNKKRYKNLKLILENTIIHKFDINRSTLSKDAELTFLMLDSLSCPFITSNTKSEILNIYGIDASLLSSITSKQEYWFTKWNNFNFEKELDAKHSQEVY